MTTDTPQAEPLRLLALADDTGVVNRVLSAVRRGGLDVQATLATTLAEAERLLTTSPPDLLLCFELALPATDALLLAMEKHAMTVPLILASSSAPADDELPGLYARGITQVLDPGQPGRLATAVLQAAAYSLQQRRLRDLELTLRELEQRQRRLLDHSPLAIAYVRDGMHLYCNDAYARLFVCDSVANVSATPLLDLVPAGQREALRAVLEQIRQSGEGASFTATAAAGDEEDLRFDFSPVRLDGKDCLQLTVQHAAGNLEHAQAVAQAKARDLLTTLDSRNRFLGRLETAIRRAIGEGRTTCLIVLELDNFDDIVTALGRSAASRILRAVAAGLPRLISVPFRAGRLDNHSFGILLEEGDPDRALEFCRVLEGDARGGEPGELAASLGLQASAGMMLVNGNALDAEDLIAKARLARRRMPAANKSLHQYRIASSLETDTADMLAYLRTALQSRRFQPAFQPIVGLGKQERRCYELLIRMLDLDGNEIPPADFIPLATLNGLGEALDCVVTDIAIEALQAADGTHQLNINITESTLLSHTYLPWLSDRLRETGLKADRLMIDISEIALHALQQQALGFCAGLQELGVAITLGNFGCALSPLDVIKQVAPTFVTLDTSLVRNLVYSKPDQERVKALIAQLHADGLEVVIPRVENMATLPLLWDLGADYIQGFSVQAPRHAMDFEFVQDQEITITAPGPARSDLQAG